MREENKFEILDNFIVFEGLDGSGTTTQARFLEQYLSGFGPTFLTCEPTSTFLGEAVRKILKGEETVASGTLAKLFAVDRHNHLFRPDTGIVPQVRNGTKVISDRYLFSSLAYQSIDRPYEEVWELNQYFPLPRHLVYLDITPQEGNTRLDNRGNPREVYERIELQEEIRDNYFHTFSLYQHTEMHLHIFDASLSKETLARRIREKLDTF